MTPEADARPRAPTARVTCSATRADFEASVAIHPTIAEEMVTFGGWGQVPGGPDGAPRPYLPPYLRPSPAQKALRAIGAALVVAVAATALVQVARRR